MIRLLLLLAAAPVFAAEPPPLTLESVAKLKGTVTISPNFKFAAAAGEQTVNVWQTSDGRQLARFDLPRGKPVLKAADDLQGFQAVDISSDGRRLLLVRGQRVALAHGNYSTNESTLFVMNLEDGSSKPLLARRSGCRWFDANEGIKILNCPSATGSFFPDGKRAAFFGFGYTPESFLASRVKEATYEYESAVVENGKVLVDLTQRVLPQAYPDGQKRPPLLTGAAGVFGASVQNGKLVGVVQDDSSCETRDLMTGKRVSFLESCTHEMSPNFVGPGLLASSADDGFYAEKGRTKVWDLASGKLVYQSTGPKVSIRNAADADVVFLYDEATGRLEARDASFRRVLGVGQMPGGPEDHASLVAVSPDGARLAVYGWSNGTTIYKTGLNAAPLSAAAAPQAEPEKPAIDVDAPPAVKAKRDPDAYAVVIGVEKYRQDGIPAVDYAARDASTVYAYLTQAMGFDAKNVVLLTDEHATRTDFEKNLGKWLQNRVSEKSRVFVYYAGHGAPNPASGEGYLMPYEADPNYVEDTAYPVAKLYAALGKLPTKDVTVVLDACFSGQGGRSLIAKGARPLVIVKAAQASGNTVVLAAASSSQISAADPQRRHGLLTEYLLEALHGAADTRGDGRITADEIYAYVRPAVERAARLQNIEQTPTMAPAPEKGGRPWIQLK